MSDRLTEHQLALVQAALMLATGDHDLRADGQWGDHSRRVWNEYQMQCGITPTDEPVVGDITLARLSQEVDQLHAVLSVDRTPTGPLPVVTAEPGADGDDGEDDDRTTTREKIGPDQ